MPRNFDIGGARVKRRTIEKNYKRYDSPEKIFNAINGKVWPYSKTGRLSGMIPFYEMRDRAYMALEYLSTCRASELCRANLKNAGYKPSVTRGQFEFSDHLLLFNECIILKRRLYLGKDDDGIHRWGPIVDQRDYPFRNQIALPLDSSMGGELYKFTELIVKLLDVLGPEEELFKFRYRRGWQIVNCITGEMQHYLRDMGLKLYSRILDRNIKDLQDFSGHARMANLTKYLGEGQLETAVLKADFKRLKV